MCKLASYRGCVMKKIISGLIAANLILFAFTSAALSKEFTDVDSNYWAYKEIVTLENDGVIVGYPDKTFKPDQSATRAEFATMTVKALRQENCNLDEYYYFKDVPKTHWAFDMVQKAHKFDLIKGYPTEYFDPEKNISRLDAFLMMVASVETSNIDEEKALTALKSFEDSDKIPENDRVNIGKAQVLSIISNDPERKNMLDTDKEITRAQISYSLYNMRKQALQRPNSKLAEAMKPKFADGIIIDPVSIDDKIVTIPAGTLIPANLVGKFSSQENIAGDLIVAKTPDNLVTKEKYFLIPKDSNIYGQVTSVKPARYFIRNAKAVLDTQEITIFIKPKAPFGGNVQIDQVKRNWFKKAVNFVIRGTKVKLNEGQKVYIKLDQPVKIDITNQTIIK